jgi:hypothetical protein
MSKDQARYKAAVRQLERELDLEWKRAEREQDKPTTRILGHLGMRLVMDRSRVLELMKLGHHMDTTNK